VEASVVTGLLLVHRMSATISKQNQYWWTVVDPSWYQAVTLIGFGLINSPSAALPRCPVA